MTISAYGDTKLFQVLRTAIFFTSTTTVAHISAKRQRDDLVCNKVLLGKSLGMFPVKKIKILPDMRDFCNSLGMDVFTLSGSEIQLQDTEKRIL